MNQVLESLKKRYPDLHPLIFQRAAEKSKTNGQLFDLLETMPNDYPIVWDDEQRAFVHTEDLLQLKSVRKGRNQ
jgi:hypothetical protein